MFQQQPHNSKTSSTQPNTQNHHSTSQSHHYLHPLTLTQLSLQQLSENNNLDQSRSKEGRGQWQCWSDDEHLHLSVLFRDMGPSWEQIKPHFENRQTGQIKRHFFASLKKIYERLITNSQHAPNIQPRFKTMELKDLKKLIDEMRKQKHRNEQMYSHSRSIQEIYQMQSPQCSLTKDLTVVVANICKRNSNIQDRLCSKQKLCSLKNIARHQLLQPKRIKIEQGYQSDSSSVFQEQIMQDRNQLPSIDEFRQDEVFKEAENNQKVQPAGLRVVVQQEEEKIRQLLKREGLLQFENPDSMEQAQQILLEVQDDNLNNESYQHFCTNDFIETNRASCKGRSAGVSPSAMKVPKNIDPTQ